MDRKIDTIHLKAPGAWINDPNGFIFYKGMYHLFYQCFPYAARWGTMHWGHAVSKDLVHWEHQGIALFPSRYEDQNGCFSGTAIEHEGRMYLFYTGVHYLKINPENTHKCLNNQYEASQLMISSEDGMSFDNFNGKQVLLPPMQDPEIGDRTDTRDPKVWKGRDGWYMMLGSRTADRRGKLLFYRSEDLREWTFVNDVTGDSDLGWMWECPDYFEADGRKILIVSPMGYVKDGKKDEDQAVCGFVDFEEVSCSMKLADCWQFLDYGLELYAPQTTVDAEGRRVLAAWMRMPEAVDGRWRGMFCIPRVVEARADHIYFRVHPNVEQVYTKQISSAEEADAAGYRISMELEEGEQVNVGGYQICCREGRICTDRTAVCAGYEDRRMTFATPKLRDGRHVDIYVDENLIEVFVNKGEYVVSNVVYGLGKEISSSAAGDMEICTLE